MNTKKKQTVVWFRFQYADEPKTRAAVILAADRMFKGIAGISERRTYTEEEVVGMVKEALEQVKRKQVFTPAEIMEAREQLANITITQTNTDRLPRVRIEWPTGEVSVGVLKQTRKEPAE